MTGAPPERALTGLIRLCVSRPVGVFMVGMAVVVFGVISYRRLAIELMPPIRYPTMTIRTEYPGSAPAEVKKFVSEPIEEGLGVVSHLQSIESRSRAGTSDIRLEFAWGTDMDQALLDIREKLNEVQRQLPTDAGKPLILRYDPSLDPVLRIAMTVRSGRDAPEDLVRLKYLAEEEVKLDLARIPGVASVEVHGGLEEEIRIDVDRDRAASLGLDLSRIAQRVQTENVNVPAGEIFEGETRKLVRTLNEFRDQTEIEDLVLVHQQGASIRLGDVATVRRTYKEREVVTRVGGRPAILVDVYKEAQANIVEVARAVREHLERAPGTRAGLDERERPLQERLGDDVALTVVSDRSIFIVEAIDEVQTSAVIGGALAVVVLFLFLGRFGPTALVGVSIPLSILATFAPMHLGGLTLNVMSLGGLGLGIGMLVDNSIVVLESIHRWREEGLSPFDAAVRGTGEVAAAVTSSTLTTVAVFAPLVFVSGIAGQLFRDQALTVVFSLSASLVVSLTVIPMLSGRDWRLDGAATPGAWRGVLVLACWRHLVEAFRTGSALRRALAIPYAVVRFAIELPLEIAWKLVSALALALTGGLGAILYGLLRLVERALRPLLLLFDAGVRGLRRANVTVLDAVLDRKLVLLLLLVPLGWYTWTRYGDLGSELLPPLREGEFHVEVALAPGTPVEATDDLVAPDSKRLGEDPAVATLYTEVGVEPTDDEASEKGSHTAVLAVVMRPGSGREAEASILEDLRERLESRPGVQSFHVSRPTLFTLEDPIAVVVYHDDLAVLRRLADRVVDLLADVPGVKDVRSSLRRGSPEMLLAYDREALARHDVGTRDVAERVRRNVQGEIPTQLREGERKIDVRVRLAREGSDETAMVRAVRVTPPAAPDKRLDEVARIDVAEGPSEIRRVSHQDAAVVTADIEGFDLGTLSSTIRERLAGVGDEDGADVVVAGQNRELEESRRSMLFAIALAVFLVYVIMASQFESLVQPLVILVSVPLAGIGVVLALDALGLPVSILVYTGSIVLAGVVVNNAIVLVDCVNHLRDQGVPRRQAIRESVGLRLRPILMTTITTVVGLAPMTGLVPIPAVLGQGVELRAPLAITIIAGLSFSTLLTLLVIPVLYDLLDGIDPSTRRFRRADAA